MLARFVFLILVVLSFPVLGQTGSISGIVKDSISNEFLEYATVSLFQHGAKKAITGSVTDKTGAFKISPVNEGTYDLMISFLSYETRHINNIVIRQGQYKINLNTIYLQLSPEVLQEISIDGSLPAIDYRIDKKVISVNKQLAAQAGSAIDILENVSSVQVDINGNVRLRGSTGITVLLDGKPTLQSPGEALRQIPAKTIESIEIITNPSARFDAEGSAGIINIISKKDKLEGFSTYADLVAGSFGRYGADLLVKYQHKNYNLYFGADYNKRGLPGKQSLDRKMIDKDSTFFTSSTGSFTNDRKNANIRAGIEFSTSERDIFSVEMKYRNWKTELNTEMVVDEWTVPESVKVQNTSFETRIPGGDIYTVKAFYKRLFKEKGHQIKASFSYDYQNSEDNPVNELKSKENQIVDGKKNFEHSTAQLYRLKVDYDLPIGKNGKFEAGLQSRFELYHDNTSLQVYDTDAQEYFVFPGFTQQTDYLRNIHSVYAMYGSEVKQFEYQLGIRGEFTDRVIDNTNRTEDFTFNKIDLFPSVHVSYHFKKKNTLFASYTRRIDRPRSSWLEPFITWEDAFNLSTGNPDLIPEYYDSYELGYFKKFNKNLISIESYYRVSHNKVENLIGVFEENVMISTYQNVGQDYSLGLELTFNYKLFNWWKINLLGNFFKYRVAGELDGFDFSNKNNSWSSRFNNTFTFYKTFRLQLNSLYNGPIVDAQGRFEGYYRLNAAVKSSFWKNRFSATLEVRDIFSSVKRTYTGEGPRFRSHFVSQRNAPRVTLTISFQFDNQ